ncbi:MAG: mechanosensitive ion channel [Deltaproteobacteria bacterium]|nr:mechanosensitive ion channel [Deltaproteobacteria bacterium]
MDSLDKLLNSFAPQLLSWFGDSRLVGALAFFIISVLVSWLVKVIFDRVLMTWATRTRFTQDEEVLKVIDRPIWQSIILLGAALAVIWLQPGAKIVFIALGFLKTIAVLVWAMALYRLSDFIFDLISRGLIQAGRTETGFVPLLANVTRVLVIVGAVLVFLSVWRINVTPMLASAGLAGLAVALAARDTLANFFGGISVFMDRPYKIGDFIVFESGERGEVVDIGIRSTRIKTRDDIQIVIPNSNIAGSKIINESAPEPRFRVRIKVGVAYGSDLDQVEKILLDIAVANKLVADEPAPRVRFRAFGDSALEFELLCWINDPRDRGLAVHELNRSVYNKFAEHGVTIPFPQRDLHIKANRLEPD